MTSLPLIEEVQGSVDATPEQFQDIWHHGTTLMPEVELQVALLEQAVEDLRRRKRRIRHEAVLWVENEDEKWPFSFLNVCARLGLDPGAVRHRLIGDDAPNDGALEQLH